MKTTPILNSFVAGELSPRLTGRTDIQQYFQSAESLQNTIVEFYGGAKKAPGTYFVSEVKDSTKKTRVIKFVFSDTQAYIIEIGDLYMRFFMDDGAILEDAKTITGITKSIPGVITVASHGYSNLDEIYIEDVEGMTEINDKRYIVASAAANTFAIVDKDGDPVDTTGYTTYSTGGSVLRVYTLTTTYTEDEIFDLQFAQTADILYITHPDHAPAKLTRTDHDAWTLTSIDFTTGEARPALMDENITDTTITPSSSVGAGIILTASAAVFDADHIGSVWKIHDGYVKIVSVSTGGLKTVAVADVLYTDGDIGGLAAYTDWSEGSWSEYRGYPKSVTLNEQRLFYGYTRSQPQTIWGSQTGAYETFELGSDDADGLSFTLATNEVEVVQWLFPSGEILIGTPSGVHSLGSGSSVIPLTPDNVVVKKKTNYGASSVMPQSIGNYVFYWQKYNRILREYVYSLDVDSYLANDATILSEHITESGIVDMAYQQSPLNILWCVRADGKLVSFTRQTEQKVSAWAPHTTDGNYESVAVIPKVSYDEVWFVIQREIDGTDRRYIEYMTAPEFDEQEDVFFVQSGLTIDLPKDITGATQAEPVVITCVSHGFSNLDKIKIRNVLGMTELNDKRFTVIDVAANSFSLIDFENPLDPYNRLLIHFDGSDGVTTYTAETGQTVTFVGTAQLDTAEKEFGTASLLLDGNSDYVTLPDSINWALGSIDFTIEMLCKRASIDSQQFLIHWANGGYANTDVGFSIYWNADNKLNCEVMVSNTSRPITSASAYTDTDDFHHIAMTRSGGTLYLFYDGELVGTNTDVKTGEVNDLATTLKIGVNWFNTSTGDYFFNGWIDEVRISKGIARWTDNFTPPTAAYSLYSLIDGSDYTEYISGGEARKCYDSVSGLDHLEGKTVQVLVDGAVHTDEVVSDGAITLDDYFSQITVGLGYTARIKTNDLEGSPGNSVSQGKNKSITEVNINMYRSLGCKIGTEDQMDEVTFRTSAMPLDQAPALFTGIKTIPFPAGWERKKQIIIEQEQPLPMHVLSIVPVMETN